MLWKCYEFAGTLVQELGISYLTRRNFTEAKWKSNAIS